MTAVALVVGGGSGLGAATARRLSGDGWTTIVGDLDVQRAQAVADGLPGAVAQEVDVTDEASVARAVDDAAQRGDVRVVVCCAGFAWAERLFGKHGMHDQESWDRVLAVNLSGSFRVLRHGARVMAGNDPDEEGGRGVCVVTSSIAAPDGQAGGVAYVAAKAGVAGLVLSSARDLGRYGVRVNAVLPGTFETPLLDGLPERTQKILADHMPFPQRPGRPEEYASLVAEIVRNPMINGALLRIDGALRIPDL